MIAFRRERTGDKRGVFQGRGKELKDEKDEKDASKKKR
jgi:hypothetical protein